jgi:DNA-binding PucR family transcriptional regulator
MPDRGREDDALVAKTGAMIIGRLHDRMAEITRSCQELLASELPDVAADGELLELVYASVEGNFNTFFPAVRHGIPIEQVEPPPAALEHARRLAQRGVDANTLVRAYRLGHGALMTFILEEIRAAQLDTQLSLEVFEQITSTSFRYVDRISDLALSAYQNERDRWLANQNRVRALRVDELLNADEIDIDEMATAISYPLRRTHVALIVWCGESEGGNELVSLERFATELAKSLGARERPLFVAADRVTGWAWIPLPTEDPLDVVARMRAFVESRAAAPSIAAGIPLPGVGGFRRSHQLALVTRSVMIASASPRQTVAAASDPGLVVAAQFCTDLKAARAWVSDVLGPLAGMTDTDERLRETLRVFLHAGSSFKATAEELHLHFNSVKYRVQRAIERRGSPIDDDRLDVEVALLLCHLFDTVVLT